MNKLNKILIGGVAITIILGTIFTVRKIDTVIIEKIAYSNNNVKIAGETINNNAEEILNAVKTEFQNVKYEDLANVLNPYIRWMDENDAKNELKAENNGQEPTSEEIRARVIKNYMDRLDMRKSFDNVKTNLDTLLKRIFERSTNINNSYVIENKNKILLGLTYLERQYNFDLNGTSAKDLILFSAKYFGNTQEPLDNIITIGTLSYTDVELINNLNTYTKKIAPIVNKTNITDFIESSLTLLSYNKTPEEWFKNQTKAYIYETTSNYGETKLYNKIKNNDNLKRYLIPLLTLTEKNIYAISTSKTVNFGLTDTYIDKTNEAVTTAEFLKNLEETGKKQEAFLNFWYRISSKRDTLINYSDIIIIDTMQKYQKNNETASQLWSAQSGENALSGVREFMTPLKLYNTYMMADGVKTSSTSFVLYLAKSLTDRGQSVYTHEITHILDEVVWFNGYGRREGKDVEVFARGLFESLDNTNGASGYSSIFNLNTTYEITGENRTQNASPERFQTESDLKQYMQGVLDVIYTLDYAEAQAILAKQNSEKAILFNKVQLIEDPKDNSKVVDNFVHITEEEAKNIQNINDIIEKGLVSGRLEYKGNLTTGIADSNGYYVIPLFEPIYAGLQNNTGATGDVTFRRNAYDILGEYGYNDGMAVYLSNQYANDQQALNAILEPKYNGSLVEFKKDMFNRRIENVDNLKPTQYFNDFEELQNKMNEAVNKDLAIMEQNKKIRNQQSETDPFRVGIATNATNVRDLKLKIYQEYLKSTNEFKNSIYEDKNTSSIIYVTSGHETSQEGNGTQQNPYQSLSYAISKAKNGDIIKLDGNIVYRQQKAGETFKIDKNVTIDGQNNTLSFRGSDLEILANVKLINMTLNMIPDGTIQTKIYVSGNEITFDNVSTQISQVQDDERPMIIGGPKEGSPSGTHTKINILNGNSQTRFKQIIAGNEVGDSNIPVTINISSEFAKVDNSIYLGGMGNNKVTGKVTLISNSKEANSIIGVNSIDNEVILKTSTIYNIDIVDIQNLTLEDNANVTLDNFFGVQGNIDIKENSTLWINTEGEVQINTLLGKGNLVISTDTSLIVKQDIADSIKIKLQGFERELRNNINKVYVKVNGSINNNVSVSLYMENEYYSIRKEEKQYKLVTNFDKNNIKKIEIIQTPDKISYKEGEKVDLTGIIVLLTDANDLEEMVGIEEFIDYNITFEPNANTILKATDKRVFIKIGEKYVSLSITVKPISVPQPVGVKYYSHIENYAWESEYQYKNGDVSGKFGQQLKVEAIKIKLENAPSNAKILYKAHVQDIGWEDWKSNGEQSGTTGQNKKIEAIRIKLENLPGYSVMYRAYVEGLGWQNWVADEIEAGSTGKNLKLEAIQIKIVKSSEAPKIEPGIQYHSHIENYGWESRFVKVNGQTSGIEGKGLKVEGISIQLTGVTDNAVIEYQSHVQDIGWEGWKKDGELSGTTGQNKKVEAIRIRLKNLTGYSVMYRAYVEGLGWQNWVSDGIEAGSTGKNLKLEAIQIKIVKSSEAPKIEPGVQYHTHIENYGWENRFGKVNGQTSGIIGRELKVEAICLQLTGVLENAKIEYQSHIQDIGWENDWKKDGETSGTTGQNKKIEAIKIKISNLPGYSVMYRAYVQGQGWQSWVKDGEIAGTTGKNLRLEAIEVKIVKN